MSWFDKNDWDPKGVISLNYRAVHTPSGTVGTVTAVGWCLKIGCHARSLRFLPDNDRYTWVENFQGWWYACEAIEDLFPVGTQVLVDIIKDERIYGTVEVLRKYKDGNLMHCGVMVDGEEKMRYMHPHLLSKA